MSLTVTIPTAPSFVKDGINIEITTTTTGVEAHYIVCPIVVGGKTITAKQPVIDGKAIFNIAELINSKSNKIFDLSADLVLFNSQNHIPWMTKSIYELYNHDDTHQGSTMLNYGHSYRGSQGNHNSTKFLTNFRKKIIHRSEFVILFFNSRYIVENGDLLQITFNNEEGIVSIVEEALQSTYCLQILIKPDIIPTTATEMIVKIVGKSEQITYQISDFNVIDKETFIYRNSFGVYDTISLFAHKEITDNYSFETFRGIESESKYNSLYQEETSKATYFLFNQFEDEKEAAFTIRELFTSEEVHLVNEDYSTTPIIITDSNRPIYSTQDQMFSLEITYKKPFKNA